MLAEKGGLKMDELKMFDIVYADFSNNKVGSEQSGVHPYVIVQNNTIDTTGDNAIRFANIQGSVINGNIIRNYPNDKRGISLNTCTFSNVSNNHITGLNYGISISCESASVTTGMNTVYGNVLNGNTIELLNGSRDNIVTNNIIKGKTLSLDEANNIVTNNRIVS